MRALLLVAIFCLGMPFCVLHAQTNLVPNPSFEDTIYCPGVNGPGINYTQSWVSYRGTPDYLHPCANTGPLYPNGQPVYGVPLNIGGYQTAKHGVAYAGLFTWCCSIGANQREIMGTILTSYLTIGTEYYFSCYISNGDSVESNAATNNLGMTLSTIPYNGTPGYTMLLSNFSFVKVDTVMGEKNNWVRMSGSLIADSAYRFLAIGNFYSDNNTLISSGTSASPLAYYYIDAVCLTTDSLYDQTWTSVSSMPVENNNIIYPNPAQSYFILENNSGYRKLKIADISGKIVIRSDLSYGKNNIPVEHLSNGIYFISTDELFSRKLIICRP